MRPSDAEISEAIAVLRGSASGERTWLALRAHPGEVPYIDVDDYLPRIDHPLRAYAIDWTTFWTDDDDSHDWLCEPLLARGRAHALYAAAKTGKSFVALAVAAAVATGRPFLGRPASAPMSVMFCDWEMGADDIRERLEDFGYGPSDDLSHLHYVLLPDVEPLDTREGGLAFMESVAAWQAELVFIDTTSRAVRGDENASDTIRDYFRHTGQRLKQAGVTVVRIDHQGKDADRGMRGTSGKADDVDVVAKIERTEDGVTWVNTHRRVSWVPPTVGITITEHDDGLTTFALRDGPAWPAGTKDLADQLDQLGVPLDATVRPTVELLRVAGTPRRRQVVTAALRHRRDQAELDVVPAQIAEPTPRSTANTDRTHPRNHQDTGVQVVPEGVGETDDAEPIAEPIAEDTANTDRTHPRNHQDTRPEPLWAGGGADHREAPPAQVDPSATQDTANDDDDTDPWLAF
jgi:hypothetical protein